jgi:archaellum biogenesis ATPase FlaH
VKIEELKDYDGEDKIISSLEMDLDLKVREKATLTVKTGLPSLDRSLGGGYQAGELYAISGPTKNGKTTLARTLTRNAELQTRYPLWFSFELPPRQFLDSFPSMPFFYMPKKLKSSDMNWIVTRILEAVERYACQIVFIDHLHYLFDLARTRNPSIEIGTVIRRLKTLAVEHALTIFLLCHTNKNGAENISYQSIRDSSFVAQESDSVLMICRTKGTENQADLRVEFHRRTGVLERVIRLVMVKGYLEEQGK